ncbi:MAG TPA: NUDIX hydrolase [Verrucomicrobiae bacterium]|jgi:ADP-ribose pyrophosphatase|nr:NUDIX hydrolase [Verrucomicrobiae bacterium]
MKSKTEIKARRLSRKKIYRGYCFDVFLDRVVWPNGQTLDRDLLVHRHDISVMVPVLDRSRLILIRQYRYGAEKYLWEIPAGTIGPKESALACAKRELVEEIGYAAKRWKKLAAVYASPGFNTELIHCFAAEGLVQKKIAHESDEIIQARVFTRAQVKAMIRSREIQDAKTLLALFYFFGGAA